ncbi:ATP binding [Dimargaris verticillata]|uniref:ATP binding n=1 Tax=Dimargaris verticillata TaxID=2761393 RepID=A0A9W8BC68_9FUNG|nr:ATP binding [Dimargaris verticillata]
MASSPLKQSYTFHTNSALSSPGFNPRFSLTNVLRWDEQQVARWLHDNNFGQYEQVFVDNNITGQVLFDLDYRLLRQLNIATVGERVKLSVAIKKLQRLSLQIRDAESTTVHSSAHEGSSTSLGLPTDSPTASSPRYPPSITSQGNASQPNLYPVDLSHDTPSSAATHGPVSPRSLPTGDSPYSTHSPRLRPQPGSAASQPNDGPAPSNHARSPASTPGTPATMLSATAPLTSKRRGRPISSVATSAKPSSASTRGSTRPDKSTENVYRMAENLQVAIMGTNHVRANRPSSIRRSHRHRHHENQDVTLDTLRTQLSEFFGTSADSDVSHLADSLSLRKMQAQQKANSPAHPPRRCVRVMWGGNETRLVDVTNAPDGRTILNRILTSFQIFTETDRYSLFSVSGIEGSAKSLSDAELFELCANTQRLEKEKLILRMKHLPFNSIDMRRRRELNETMRILEQLPVDRAPGESSAINSPALPPERPLKLSTHSHKKVANFFGERPPSELISSNLAQYFPGNEEKARHSMFRASTIHDRHASRGLNHLLGAPPANGIPPGPLAPALQRRTLLSSVKSLATGTDTADTSANLPSPRGPKDPAVLTPATSHPNTSTPSLVPRDELPSEALALDETLPTEAAKPSSPTTALPLPVESTSPPRSEESPKLSGDENLATEGNSEEPLNWIQGALIGMGSFGNVYLGLNSLSGELMAVKQVDLPQEGSANEARKQLMLNALHLEIKILEDLKHEHIVRYLGSQMDDEHLNIFLEYVPGGSVAAMLANYGPLQETLVRSFVRQILRGLSYLHEREIIHRDIKGGNILVDIKGGVKISDFGISKKIEHGEDRLSLISNRSSLKGSVFWMAPEVVKKTHYTRRADIWSLGCLVIEMLTGSHPFPNFTEMQAMFKIGSNTSPAIPDNISPEARDFLTKTLALDYLQRPTADQLLSHPFVQESKP